MRRGLQASMRELVPFFVKCAFRKGFRRSYRKDTSGQKGGVRTGWHRLLMLAGFGEARFELGPKPDGGLVTSGTLA